MSITIGLCDDLRERVRRFELDAALTIEGTERATECEGSRIISPAQLNLVVSQKNLRAQKIVGRSDLASQTFLLADSGGALNELLHKWFKNSVHAPKFESAGSIDGVKRGIQNSDAIGVLPSYTIAAELLSRRLVALRVRDPLPVIALLLTTSEPILESSPLYGLVRELDGAALLGKL